MSVVTSLATVFASSAREMWTPGIVPPVARDTVPLIDPPVPCALANSGTKGDTREKAIPATADFLKKLMGTLVGSCGDCPELPIAENCAVPDDYPRKYHAKLN